MFSLFVTASVNSSVFIPELFARGGGGGSGGGGGGGGGALIILIGYVPTHFIGAFFRKLGHDGSTPLWGQIVGWAAAIAYGVGWIAFGGGFGVLVSIGAVLGIGAGLYGWFGKIKQSKFVRSTLKTAAQSDPVWDEAALTEYATDIFMRYQQDWSGRDTEAMRDYMTPHYQQHAALLVYILQQSGRHNLVQDVIVSDATIVAAQDSHDDTQDSFTVAFEARAHDILARDFEESIIFQDDNTFVEYWHFNRNGNTWLLNGITQATASSLTSNPLMVRFADERRFYYSEDMGWLFIPERGMLFSGAKFGTSDINNHIVGLYKNQLLIQIYTYVSVPKGANSKSYVIAQANLPRSYGQIVVRRKKRLQLTGIRGLERVQTEWIEFNGMYEVFASDGEQAASFELLNPTYMEKLAALPFEVNIEVVDNVVYLYTNEARTDIATYETMTQLLELAFNEMKL